MAGPFRAVKVSEHVYWVGVVDWGLRDFHGYSTNSGSTYNAYLVVGEENILIDGVKAPFKDELLSRISSVVDPSSIRYIISNHSEMDHSGALPALVDEISPEKIYASPAGVKNLTAQLEIGCELEAVPDSTVLEFGGLNFHFFETKMLHWPDSMITYLAEDKLLFSQDGFGMHLASGKRFADEMDRALLYREGVKYYANILTPYSPLVLKLLDRVDELGVPIEMICPDHGPIWRGDDCGMIIGWWKRWAEQKPTPKAVVLYDTMWGSTEKMGRAIEEGLASEGIEVAFLSAKINDRSTIATELLEAGAIIVGSPTMNNMIYPSLADVLTYLKGLRFRNLVGAAFGSYGWSGEGAKQVEEYLEGMKVDIVSEMKNTIFVPDSEELQDGFWLGVAVANMLNERLA